MPFDVDTAYAPELLIFRLTEWPSVDEQVQLHGRLTARGLLTENTVALIDVRSADMVPTDAMIQAVAATLKGTGGAATARLRRQHARAGEVHRRCAVASTAHSGDAGVFHGEGSDGVAVSYGAGISSGVLRLATETRRATIRVVR
jgi:hypothetical protein